MTEQPKSQTGETVEALQRNLPQPSDLNASPLRNFLSGFFFSGIIVFAFVSMSMYYTHTPLLDLGPIKLAISAVIPLTVGCLSVASKGRLVNYLADIETSAQLPF